MQRPSSTSRGNLWAIVLAAGDGTRLAAVTAGMYGRLVPKQFAAFGGARTFLQRTLDRIAPLVPAARTVVVVAEAHAALAEEQLSGWPGVQMVRQPANRGTGVGLLLPLAHVLAKDPDARVVVFPSDHHVRRPRAFLTAVEAAVAAAEAAPAGVSLVGAAAEGAATDLGWIVPDAPCAPGARGSAVAHFVEKPDRARACALLERGGLWNTLVVAAQGRALWALAARHAPVVAAALERYRSLIGRPEAPAWLRATYAELPTVDLSRDILERAQGLRVVSMVDAGWSDCGTPERLLDSLPPGRERDWLRRWIADAATAAGGPAPAGAP